MKRIIRGGWQALKNPKGKYNQRGAGRHTLCGQCNNDTGAWYGSDYVDWVRQGMRLLGASGGRVTLSYPYEIYPLRVIKQIATMFFSACGPGFHEKHPELVRFVLNKEMLQVPERIRFYTFFQDPNKSTGSRQSGVSGVLNLERARPHVFSEIVFPPYGFIMMLDTPPIDQRLCDITHFGEFAHRTRSIRHLRLPVLPIVSWLPADFRDEEEIEQALASSSDR